VSQIFSRKMNFISRFTIFGSVFVLVAVSVAAGEIIRSPWLTEAHVVRVQPVPFSHKHHVGDLGLDCRYCHTTVEESSFAGIPPTKTCMNCHSQVYSDSPMLEPVRQSFRENVPLKWVRVNNLPGYVYFDHSIHLNKGVGCVTCHGQVNEMPLMWRENTLTMEWCLECHRNPAHYVRPREQVFAMQWKPNEPQEVLGSRLVKEYRVRSSEEITNCSTCHR
jgi:hypothetical protein